MDKKNKTKNVGGHSVVYDLPPYESLVTEIVLNQSVIKTDIRLRDLLHQLQKKAAIARHNVNEIYPTAQTYEAREYVAELENCVEALERALKFKQAYIIHVHGSTYTGDMVLSKEEIN